MLHAMGTGVVRIKSGLDWSLLIMQLFISVSMKKIFLAVQDNLRLLETLTSVRGNPRLMVATPDHPNVLLADFGIVL